MEISQLNMMLVPNILGVTQDETKAVEIFTTQVQHMSKSLTDSFAMLMHLFNHLPTLHLASQPYVPRTQLAFPLYVHYKSGKLKASAYPHSLAQMYGYWLQHLLQWQLE